MQNPKYDINQVVYFRESAAMGHLEPVIISGMSYYNGQWIYTIRANRALPIPVSQYGDRVNLTNGALLQFTENELVILCDALALAEANATNTLRRIQLQRVNLCPDITEQ
jgi:hypothetical protein